MKELDILELRKLYKDDMVFLTTHCSLRLEQRGITEDDIESALKNGEIIEQYPDDYTELGKQLATSFDKKQKKLNERLKELENDNTEEA